MKEHRWNSKNKCVPTLDRVANKWNQQVFRKQTNKFTSVDCNLSHTYTTFVFFAFRYENTHTEYNLERISSTQSHKRRNGHVQHNKSLQSYRLKIAKCRTFIYNVLCSVHTVHAMLCVKFRCVMRKSFVMSLWLYVLHLVHFIFDTTPACNTHCVCWWHWKSQEFIASFLLIWLHACDGLFKFVQMSIACSILL